MQRFSIDAWIGMVGWFMIKYFVFVAPAKQACNAQALYNQEISQPAYPTRDARFPAKILQLPTSSDYIT